jgi:hypothetical protein
VTTRYEQVLLPDTWVLEWPQKYPRTEGHHDTFSCSAKNTISISLEEVHKMKAVNVRSQQIFNWDQITTQTKAFVNFYKTPHLTNNSAQYKILYAF